MGAANLMDVQNEASYNAALSPLKVAIELKSRSFLPCIQNMHILPFLP